MAQWLRVCTTLVEDMSFIPSAHVRRRAAQTVASDLQEHCPHAHMQADSLIKVKQTALELKWMFVCVCVGCVYLCACILPMNVLVTMKVRGGYWVPWS